MARRDGAVRRNGVAGRAGPAGGHGVAGQDAGPVADVRGLTVTIAVKSLEDTAEWYRDQLGFQVVLQREFPEYFTRIAFLEANGVRIELVEDQRWTPVDRPDPPNHTTLQGVSQITFRVDDIVEVVARVKSRRITVAWDLVTVADLGLKEFFIRDNEGNVLQFVQWDPIGAGNG